MEIQTIEDDSGAFFIVMSQGYSGYIKELDRDFHSLYKVGRNGSIGIKGFNNSKKKLPQVGLDLMQEIITSLRVQCLTN